MVAFSSEKKKRVPDAISTSRAKLEPKPDVSDPTRLPTVSNLSFNQGRDCFAVATDLGFRVYICDPFRLAFRREFFFGGGVALVRMLNTSQFFAIAGRGPDPTSPPNKVMIWDDHLSLGVHDMPFRSEVRGLKLRHDRVVVVLKHKIVVRDFLYSKVTHDILTTENP